jgi:hypothetical protein
MISNRSVNVKELRCTVNGTVLPFSGLFGFYGHIRNGRRAFIIQMDLIDPLNDGRNRRNLFSDDDGLAPDKDQYESKKEGIYNPNCLDQLHLISSA